MTTEQMDWMDDQRARRGRGAGVPALTPVDIAARAAAVAAEWTPGAIEAESIGWATGRWLLDAIEALLADRERLRGLATADVIAFLMGEGELDGCSFGERPQDALGAFWWRRHLAALRAAILDGGGA